MSIIHHWLSGKVLHTRYTGNVTSDELLQGALDVSGNPCFDDLRGVISDWSEARKSDVNVSDVERLAAYTEAASRTNPHILHISVMRPGIEAPQALISLYEMYVADTPWQTVVVDTLDEAKQQMAHLLV